MLAAWAPAHREQAPIPKEKLKGITRRSPLAGFSFRIDGARRRSLGAPARAVDAVPAMVNVVRSITRIGDWQGQPIELDGAGTPIVSTRRNLGGLASPV